MRRHARCPETPGGNTSNVIILCQALIAVALLQSGTAGRPQSEHPFAAVHAELHPVSPRIPVGQPVWVRFSIENRGSQATTLTVPGARPAIPSPEVGLPLAHIFSGGSTTGVSVKTESGRQWEEPVGFRSHAEAPILMIAPHSSVGITVDLRDYFPVLRGAGRYRVTWSPYGGQVHSDPIVLLIAPLKHAEIVTDEGTLTLRFFYSDAPLTVDNFLELAESGFYNGKTFHRLEPGYLLQGGCPRGDGTGIRPDGKRLPPEFNAHPMSKGTVAMALLEGDPYSASCQFFICYTRQREWDGKYTAFAELIGDASFDTLDRLMATEVDENSRPVHPLVMRQVRVIDAPADEVP